MSTQMNLNKKEKKNTDVNVPEHTFTITLEPLSKYNTAEIFAVSLYQLSRIFKCIYIYRKLAERASVGFYSLSRLSFSRKILSLKKQLIDLFPVHRNKYQENNTC